MVVAVAQRGACNYTCNYNPRTRITRNHDGIPCMSLTPVVNQFINRSKGRHPPSNQSSYMSRSNPRAAHSVASCDMGRDTL
eukprot:1096385-Prymnesium_polylepis.1